MNVMLPADLERFVEEKVKSGAYSSVEAVLEDALIHFRSRREIDSDELRRLVAQGQASADRGELFDSESVFDEIKAESRRRREK